MEPYALGDNHLVLQTPIETVCKMYAKIYTCDLRILLTTNKPVITTVLMAQQTKNTNCGVL